MYYEHDVIVKMHITTLTDEVKPDDVKKIFDDGYWDYEVDNTRLITPVEVVAKIKDQIRLHGLTSYKHCDGNHVDLVNEILDRVLEDLEEFQSVYEESL